MTFSNLIPWSRTTRPVQKQESARSQHPVRFLHDDMNRLFDTFFHDYETMISDLDNGHSPWGAVSGTIPAEYPKVDVRDTEKELRISAEIPGMSEKDIDVALSSDTLTLAGEKKEEKVDSEKGWYRMERQYGAFTRVIPLPCEVNADKAEASFKNGVLCVILPKLMEQRPSRTITIKKEP